MTSETLDQLERLKKSFNSLKIMTDEAMYLLSMVTPNEAKALGEILKLRALVDAVKEFAAAYVIEENDVIRRILNALQALEEE